MAASSFVPSLRSSGQHNYSYTLFNVTAMSSSAFHRIHDDVIHHKNVTGAGTTSTVATTTTTPGTAVWFASHDLDVQFIAFTVMVSVCSLIGTLGNIPVLIVYCTKNERRTSNTFIKILAVIDLVVCAIIMPYTIVLELHLVSSDILCRFFEFIRHFSVAASNLTLVAIAVERYVAVCLISHRMTVYNVNKGMFMVVGISVVVAIPSMGLFASVTEDEVKDINCTFRHNFNSTMSFCHFTTSLMGPSLSLAYQAVLMIMFFVSFTVIVAIYTIVYIALWKRAKRRSVIRSFKIRLQPPAAQREKKLSVEPSMVTSSTDGIGHGVVGGPDCADGGQKNGEVKVNHEMVLYVGNEHLEESSDERTSRAEGSVAEGEELAGYSTTTAAAAAASQILSVTNMSKNHMHRRTARMLFLCSIIFLITWLPFWVDVFNFTHNLCLRYLFFVGNASNPLVYGIANSHFRRSFCRLLVGLRPCRQARDESAVTVSS